jgi:hypothetical protein
VRGLTVSDLTARGAVLDKCAEFLAIELEGSSDTVERAAITFVKTSLAGDAERWRDAAVRKARTEARRAAWHAAWNSPRNKETD